MDGAQDDRPAEVESVRQFPGADATLTETRTHWAHFVLLLAVGVVAAMQIGKVPPAISTLRADLGLGIVEAAWVLSLFSAIGAAIGSLAGPVANRFGPLRTTVIGLLCMAAASALGARANGAAFLLASRAIEGTAFVAAVVAIPSLLQASAQAEHRRFVSAVWGTYMPIGTAIAMALAPLLLLASGWRALWDWNAVLLLVFAVALIAARPSPASLGGAPVFKLKALLHTARERDVWLLALVFLCYTFQYLSVLGFLPTLLEQQGLPTDAAGSRSAFAVIANAGGNLMAGALIARHVTPRRLMAVGFAMMVVCVLGLYSPAMPPAPGYWLTVTFSFFGGFVPASIFATIPTVAGAIGSGAMAMGLIVQASHAGQMIGPPVVAALAATTGGWAWSPLALVPTAVVGFIAVFGVRAAATAR